MVVSEGLPTYLDVELSPLHPAIVFANGVWRGQFVVDVMGTNVVLAIDSGQQGSGTSNAFDVLIEDAFLVSTSVDENDGDYSAGDLSLREALVLAATRPGGDTIRFDSTLAGSTITLSLGQLEIDSHVDIQGLGADQLTLDGDGNSRVVSVRPGTTALVSGLTIRGGKACDDGGGGIYNDHGTLTLSAVLVTANSADTHGGGILNWAGVLTLFDSTVAGNEAGRSGGGIRNSGGSLTIANTTISANISYAGGGGISTSRGSVAVTNATISANSAEGGGGIFNGSGASYSNITLHNTIVAGNTVVDPVDTFDVHGEFDSASSLNVIGVIDGSMGLDGAGTLYGSVQSPLDPTVAALQWNGGCTPTHALLPDSPAIDVGSNARANAAGLTRDQRGFGRFADGDDNGTIIVDIGAYEFRGPLIVSTATDENDGDYRPGDLSLRKLSFWPPPSRAMISSSAI